MRLELAAASKPNWIVIRCDIDSRLIRIENFKCLQKIISIVAFEAHFFDFETVSIGLGKFYSIYESFRKAGWNVKIKKKHFFA